MKLDFIRDINPMTVAFIAFTIVACLAMLLIFIQGNPDLINHLLEAIGVLEGPLNGTSAAEAEVL